MTTFISQQNIDKQKLSIFLRDLSVNGKVNLKHMIEDSVRGENEMNKKKKNYNKKKKVVIGYRNL